MTEADVNAAAGRKQLRRLESLSSPVGHSLSLALLGFIGIAGWSYARKHDLVRADLSETERDEVPRNAIVAPVTALLNTAFAFVGPGAWTAGWFVIPVVLVSGRGRLERRRERARVGER